MTCEETRKVICTPPGQQTNSLLIAALNHLDRCQECDEWIKEEEKKERQELSKEKIKELEELGDSIAEQLKKAAEDDEELREMME